MQDLKEAVERIEPVPDERGDWDAVIRDATAGRRRRFVPPVAGIAIAAAALFVAGLLQPWQGENPGLLERALAAVDDGPVLHVVLRGEWGGTNVNLETGERSPVHAENEIWYDPKRELVRYVSRLGDGVLENRLFEPGGLAPELIALGRDYRAALRAGSARIAGKGVIDGQEVTWITIHSEQPSARRSAWVQQVAVSHETFKPVAIRETRDGRQVPETLRRVIELETLPAGASELDGPKDHPFEGPFQQGSEPITAEEAAAVLGRKPLWLGPVHGDLRLAEVRETFLRRGRRETLVLEPCGRKHEPRCHRVLRDRRSGPIEWGEKEVAVALAYGASFNDRKVIAGEPFLRIDQALDRAPLHHGTAYFPPAGSLFLDAGNHGGTIVVDGVYVAINASSEALVFSAARALKPMS
jgi:hypothetical protein